MLTSFVKGKNTVAVHGVVQLHPSVNVLEKNF